MMKKKSTGPTRLPSLGRNKKAHDFNHASSEVSEVEVIRIRRSADREEMMSDGLLNAVHEFLVKKNYLQTVEVFQKEMLRLAADRPTRKHFDEQLVEVGSADEAFDEGKREWFFEVWRKYVPMAMRMSDQMAIKLEFFVQIYFTVYPMHPSLHTSPIKPNSKAARLEFEKFKAYLDRQGNELSKMPELLSYFALSIVKDPQHNPTFARLFSREWVMELRNQLLGFIDQMYSPTAEPFLVQLYQGFRAGKVQPRDASPAEPQEEAFGAHGSLRQSDSDQRPKEIMDYVQDLENNNQELVDIVLSFNEKYKQLERQFQLEHFRPLQDDSTEIQKKWATFSKEILKLAKAIFAFMNEGGFPVPVSKHAEFKNKIQEFDNFLTLNMNDLMMERQTPPARLDSRNPPRPLPEPALDQLRFPALDFGKVKGFFLADTEEAEELVFAVLAGLKRRMMRGDAAARLQTILSVVQADLFELAAEKSTDETVYYRLLTHKNPRVQNEALKLLNLMSTNISGRSYLSKSEDFVELLIGLLKREQGDTKLRRRSLGVLQNLSLRSKPIHIMIKNDLVRLSLQILDREKDSLQPYSLDYFSALLMNLSLRAEGRQKFEDLEDVPLFDVLSDLLHIQSGRVRTFIHGVLYSILTVPKLKQKADALNFFQTLADLKTKVKERFQKQIDCIIRVAQAGEPRSEVFEEENEDSQAGPDDEQLDDEDISIGRLASADDEEVAEDFLQQNFPASREQEASQVRHLREQAGLKRQAEKTPADGSKPLDRPATPAMVFMEEERQGGPAAPFGQESQWLPGAQPHPDFQAGKYRVPPKTPPLNARRLASATAKEDSVVYGNQSIVIDQLPQEKKQKVASAQQILSEVKDEDWQAGFISRKILPRTPPTEHHVGSKFN